MSEISLRIKEIIEKLGISDSAFAKSIDVPQTTFSNMFVRESEPKPSWLQSIVRIHNINAEWLLTGEGEMFSRQGEEVPAVQDRIPILRQSVSCGPGQSWEEADIVEGYMEPLSLVPSARGRKVYAFRVRGTSMVGAGIDDGDTIIFDGGSGSDFSDDIYVFALDGSVYCKLVKFDEISRRISIWSVHGEMKDAELLRTLDADSPETADTFHIFGRVLAWVRENRVFRRD
ncbi:S24 family peptidase [Treponema sp.]|uniref:LexA family transcriptional regulator n=1 Tax=Treponema sp. TaxID=166 RepID=UPI00298E5C9E|nr:S24 family peptidase [Treponema sp.]